MSAARLKFPVIFKPDIGERGWMVQKIHNEDDASQYLNKVPIDFLIQEFLDLPLEFGVLCAKAFGRKWSHHLHQ